MNVLNFRVDDRLVHGVVATNWVPRMKIDRVVVIDKESAENQILKSALRMATPKQVYLSVIDTAKALENFKEDKYAGEKIMIVVKNLDTVIDLLEGGYEFKDLTLGNLGNQKKTDDTTAITKYVSVNKGICDQIEKIHNFGVVITAQLIPENTAIEFYGAMKQKYQK